MSFENPYALLLLLLLPLTQLLFRFRLRHQASLPHPDLRLLRQSGQVPIRWPDRLAFWGRLLVLTLAVIALSRPRWPDLGSRVPSEGIALMIVLDVSGSMAEKDFPTMNGNISRLEMAKSTLMEFIREPGRVDSMGRKNDAMGLVTFAVHPVDVAPPSVSHASLLALLKQAVPVGKVPDSATNIGDALAVAIDLLQRTPIKTKAILVVTDGEHNVPPEIDAQALKPREAGQLARSLGIRVHPVFLAVPTKGETESRNQKVATAALSDVAQITGGQFATIDNAASLQEITRQLDASEKSRIETFQYQNYFELYPWLGLTALILFITQIVLEETWLRSLP